MGLHRIVTLLAVACVTLSGCASRNAKLAGGTALTVAGSLLVAYQPDGKCTNDQGGQDSVTEFCTGLIATPMNQMVDVLTTAVGIGMIAAGGGLVISSALADDPHELPTPAARVEDRLAIEASTQARDGQCQSAVTAATELALRDRARFDQLVEDDAVLAHCYGGYEP